MKPLDPDLGSLLRQWIEKAEAAGRLGPNVASSTRLREIVGFHCQQAVEKYIKALLTYYQIEFPKTHESERLLVLVRSADREAADALSAAKWLGPFGVDIRYPGDASEMLPGDEVKALEIARLTKQVVLQILDFSDAGRKG